MRVGRPRVRARLLATSWPKVLLLDRGRRRHLALLCAVIAISVFAYGVLQPRKVRVEADGREITVASRESSDGALLRSTGIDLRAGDRVTELDGDGVRVLQVDRARRVQLHVDGMTYEMLTHAVTIDQLLAEANVAVTGRDSVLQNDDLVSMKALIDPPRLFASRAGTGGDQAPSAVNIEVRRAVPITIVEDGEAIETTTSRPTVAQALREAGMIIGPGDSVLPDPQSGLEAGARVEVRHAKGLTVSLPNEHQVLYTLATTVGEALSAAGISIPDGAFIEPPAATTVRAGMAVRVVQLSAANSVETEYIESKTVYTPDPSLPPGESRTVRGHDGVRVRRYDVSYVNGEEAGRTLLDETLDPEPLDTVVFYSVQRAADNAPPAATSNTGSLRVYATWYSPASSGRSPSDPAYGRTATGAVVTYGIVAVDPDVIPLGTKMFIPGYGYAVAADTGGAVKGYVIDLGYPDGVSVGWQSKWVEIEILS